MSNSSIFLLIPYWPVTPPDGHSLSPLELIPLLTPRKRQHMSKRPESNLAVALVVAGVAALAGAATIGPVLALVATAVLAALAALIAGDRLVRLALRIHQGQHSFGPCRGAGFLGLASLLTGAGTAIACGTS